MDLAQFLAWRLESRKMRVVARRLALVSGGAARLWMVDGGYNLRLGLFYKTDFFCDDLAVVASTYYREVARWEQEMSEGAA